MAKAAWLDGDDLLLRLYIQPKASRDKLIGLHGDEIPASRRKSQRSPEQISVQAVQSSKRANHHRERGTRAT